MNRPKPIQGFKKLVTKHRPAINEVVREPTSGGVIFRRAEKTKAIEILLIQDAKTVGLYQKDISKKGKLQSKRPREKSEKKQDCRK